ncbi:SOS response-associated peptidase [Micrococcales bacterium 31B]|nr:SOS response-associated peptidase [Micrococcales bacterium 31B]
MCARYVVARATRDLVASMGLLDDSGSPLQVEERYDVRPTAGVPVLVDAVRKDAGSTSPQRTCAFARWSLTPPFSRELKTRYATFNARSETVTQKPSFRHAVPGQRAILPADGYFEWLTESDGTKRPFYIHAGWGAPGAPGAPGAMNAPLLFAGLYSWWKDREANEWVLTATMLTRSAVGDVADIHDRTPMLIAPEDVAEWLDPGTVGTQGLIDDFAARSATWGKALQFHEVAPLRGAGGEHWLRPRECGTV